MDEISILGALVGASPSAVIAALFYLTISKTLPRQTDAFSQHLQKQQGEFSLLISAVMDRYERQMAEERKIWREDATLDRNRIESLANQIRDLTLELHRMASAVAALQPAWRGVRQNDLPREPPL